MYVITNIDCMQNVKNDYLFSVVESFLFMQPFKMDRIYRRYAIVSFYYKYYQMYTRLVSSEYNSNAKTLTLVCSQSRFVTKLHELYFFSLELTRYFAKQPFLSVLFKQANGIPQVFVTYERHSLASITPSLSLKIIKTAGKVLFV